MEIKNYLLNKKIKFVSLSNITVSKSFFSPYFNEGDITYHSAQFKKNGIIEPLLVRKNINDPKNYILVSHPVTYFSLLLLNLKKVPVIVLSLTDAEADLIYLLSLKRDFSLDFITEAFFIKGILKKGYFNISELTDLLLISKSALEKKLSLTTLKSPEINFIKNHNLNEDFCYLYLTLKENERERVRNETVINKLNSKGAIDFIKEMKNPKIKPIKTAIFSDDTVILNSMERIIDSLKGVGIKATLKSEETEDEKCFTISVKNKPRQLKMNLK